MRGLRTFRKAAACGLRSKELRDVQFRVKGMRISTLLETLKFDVPQLL